MCNRAILAIVFTFLTVILFAQSAALNQTDKSGKKQGHWVKKDENGKIVYDGYFKDGHPVGEFKYYYDDGQIKTVSIFSADGKICRSKHFFPGNILMAEGKYVNQKRDSIWKFYAAKDTLVSIETYKNGKKDGLEKNFSVSGKLMEEKTWKDSVLNGGYKKYYDDGSVKEEGVYNNGFFEGEIKFYYPGKIISTVGHFQHSVKHGKWIYYGRNGIIITGTENYNLGKLEGDFSQWYEKNGKPKVKGQYKGDKKVGKWQYWDEKGNLEKEENYDAGAHHGYYAEYMDDGKKRTEGNFYFGYKTGKWLEWHDDLQASTEKTYDSVDKLKKKILAEQKENNKNK